MVGTIKTAKFRTYLAAFGALKYDRTQNDAPVLIAKGADYLAEKIKERYRSSFVGVFFKRYILGLWVAAEGVIYNLFADNSEEFMLDKAPDDILMLNWNKRYRKNCIRWPQKY